MKFLGKILDGIEDWILIGVFFVLVILNFFNVVTRFLLPSFSVAYNEELSVYLFVWLCMFGASICFRDDEHLSLPLFFDMFPQAIRSIITVLGNLVTILTVYVMIYYTWLMVINQLEHNVMAQSMNIPTAFAGIAMPIGGVFMIFRSIQNSYKAIKSIFKQDNNKEEDERNA